jgi:hypothetical protein
MDTVAKLIANNDAELKKREDILIQKVNRAYENAIKGAVRDFHYLMKLNPKIKPTFGQVAKILDNMITDFQEEMNTLVKPFQKELANQYEEGLREAGNLLAFRDQKKANVS